MFDARAIKEACNGMLPVRTYDEIYRRALTADEGIFVEVGTAHAAATVCLARALKDSGRSGRVYTFEKIFGGTREAFGGVHENVQIIQDNLSRFDVEDVVELIIGDVRDEAAQVPSDARIALLFLDADGRIDRDFELFFDRMQLGGQIYIDDVRNAARLGLDGTKGLAARFKIDQKHRISYLLLDVFRRNGLVGDGDFVGPDTWAGTKIANAYSIVPHDEIVEAYRDLVFADAEMPMVPGRRMAKRALKWLLPASVVEQIRDRRERQRFGEN
ncbi:MAG: class I SAM-dependent methyltransferase [Pseudomonadota bacterium]